MKQRPLHRLRHVFARFSAPVAPPSQLSLSTNHQTRHEREWWRKHWQQQLQPWRSEPEISSERQNYLTQRRTIVADIEQYIYAFKAIRLNRADIEWLLATHEEGRGPLDWRDPAQRKRPGLDLRGADLRGADLHALPLAGLRGSLKWNEHPDLTEEQRTAALILLDEADLKRTHLEGAILAGVYLSKADLREAHLEYAYMIRVHLEGAYLSRVHLARANLVGAYMDGTYLGNVTLADEQHIGPVLADTQWGSTNLAIVDWSQVAMLNDEYKIRSAPRKMRTQDPVEWMHKYERAVRANRQLAVILEAQGLNENGTYFAYRAQVLQRHVLRLQIARRGATFRQRGQAISGWLFSWSLFLLSGYGYRLWRCFLVYFLTVAGFAAIYYILGNNDHPALSAIDALALSITSFHGRGFFPGVFTLNDQLILIASCEGFIGLVLEVTLIATLTQRFFGK